METFNTTPEIPKNPDALKAMVREKYAAIAEQSVDDNRRSCCGAGGCSDTVYTIFSEDYTTQEGYVPESDLGLGCGIPTQFADIKTGMVVLDLGSGAGNDAFVARRLVGESGKVIGVDMTPVMIDKARAHAETLGYNNVEFRLGDIEKLPIAANTIDVVLSNCVLNLVPDKTKAFSEIFRVLKPGGSFCISDVVLIGILPTAIQESAEMYVGCVSSAIQQDEYLAIIKNAGFADVQVLSAKPINIPEDILSAYLGADAAQQYLQSESPIKSITVKGIKKSSCAPGSACCS